MMNKVAIKLISIILGMVSTDVLKKVADSILDIVEDSVAKSSTKIDDALVLPLCKKVRDTFDIEDND